MYYTPKELIEKDEIVIQGETGSFLKTAFDWLVRGLTVNPPYNTGVEPTQGTRPENQEG